MAFSGCETLMFDGLRLTKRVSTFGELDLTFYTFHMVAKMLKKESRNNFYKNVNLGVSILIDSFITLGYSTSLNRPIRKTISSETALHNKSKQINLYL
jgi:hypothetical protein